MLSLQDFARSPNILAADYRHAAVDRRIQLTGHLHQALPDVCEQAYREHWHCLNKYGEEGWDEILRRVQRVREGFATMIDSAPEHIALAGNMHDLFARFLSVLPWRSGGRILTTDAEHPALARQLLRLQRRGAEVVQVAADPAATLVERLAGAIDRRTLAVCLASVNGITGQQTLELDRLLPLCQQVGAELFVDAYLSINVQHFSVAEFNLQQAFVAGGGASYCQMGSGNCFMHVPPGRDWQPLLTGGFDPLDAMSVGSLAPPQGACLFDGSGQDTLPYFRACHTLDFFAGRGLTADFLADVNHHQLHLLTDRFRALDLPPALVQLPLDVEYLGGFMPLRSPHARALSEKMRDRGVHTDYCRQWLRLGPAPYLCDEQLEDGILALEESVQELQRSG